MRFIQRVLTPAQADAIRAAFDDGAMPKQLAAQYGVHVRTIWRTLARATRRRVDVEVAGYHATFEIDELGPVQVTDWRAA